MSVLGADRAVTHERVEIQHLVPELGAEQDDRHAFAHLARLRQRQDLEQLVERAEATWEQHHRLGEVDEPEFTHEEVMKVDVKLATDEGIVELLVRDRDGEADVEPLGLGGTAIGSLHDAGTAPGAYDKAPGGIAELLRPIGQTVRELTGRLV